MCWREKPTITHFVFSQKHVNLINGKNTAQNGATLAALGPKRSAQPGFQWVFPVAPVVLVDEVLGGGAKTPSLQMLISKIGLQILNGEKCHLQKALTQEHWQLGRQ